VAITFQRAALYEEVWSEPLPTLAKKYGLSDNGLRKICKALSIPLPAAGYWAKRAAGDPAPRTALPPTAERTSFTSNPPAPQASTFHTADDDEWLEQRGRYERRPDAQIGRAEP
jgi:hypothetical protein